MALDQVQCPRCRGCGKIADCGDGEPWTVWEELPPGSDLAVQAGIVKPITCPDCDGKGVDVPTEKTPQDFFDAVLEKFHRRAADKNRSTVPWKDYTTNFLGNRLADELGEFAEASGYPVMVTASGEVFSVTAEAADELLDITNFCMFLWLQWAASRGP